MGKKKKQGGEGGGGGGSYDKRSQKSAPPKDSTSKTDRLDSEFMFSLQNLKKKVPNSEVRGGEERRTGGAAGAKRQQYTAFLS